MLSTTILTEDKGIKILKEVLLPVPIYELGTVVGYYKDGKDTAYEADIIGYHISVYATDYNDTTDEVTYEYDIQYALSNGDTILEDIVDYHYD